MNYLLAGQEPQERVELLLKLTKIKSEPLQTAIIDRLVKGLSEKEVVSLNGVLQSNFNRAMTRINDVAGIVEQIKEIDWAKFKSVK